ncbi:MAG: amidohydrolase family protein, partial [Paracoccaceae bacterium]|nr:amidohydrolase family protein [Paracoccaceae bacterium]
MHLHLRDGPILDYVVPYTSANFGRAVIMPNLVSPVTTCSDARLYRDQILKSIPKNHDFQPLMTLFLTESTDKKELIQGVREGLLAAIKLYPAGATTNSDSGVTDIEKVFPILETMIDLGLPLLIHGEVVDTAVDIFDREKVFIDRILSPLRQKYPELKIVFEHITTLDGVNFVLEATSNLSATITPHHLVLNRTDIF